MQWDILWFPQSAGFYLFVHSSFSCWAFAWDRLTSLHFLSSSLISLFLGHLLCGSCLVSQTAFLLSSLVLHPFPSSCPSAFPRSVKPSDCRVKLWNYVPGLTPCLPRRVLAIKGRATSLPWLPVLCSPILPSSGIVLTYFLFLLLAFFLFPTMNFLTWVTQVCISLLFSFFYLFIFLLVFLLCRSVWLSL